MQTSSFTKPLTQLKLFMKTETKITIITHQEIMMLYNYTRTGAIGRLNQIRQQLGKTYGQKLTVIDFCKVEGIPLEDFDTLMKRSREKV